MSRNIKTVAAAAPSTPQLPIAELFAHFKPGHRPSADPGQYLDLIMELIAQDLLNARYQGKPFDEKSLERLMRYENLRLRRESLRLRQQKTKRVSSPPPVDEVTPVAKRLAALEPEPQPPVDNSVPETPTEPPVPVSESEAPVTESVPAETVVQDEEDTTQESAVLTQSEVAMVEAKITRLELERDRVFEFYKQHYGYYPVEKSKVLPNPS